MTAIAARSIKTEARSNCPLCGGSGDIRLTHCRDYVCALPGVWSFRECLQCRSLWLDPRPTAESIPLLYPCNYGLTRSLTVAEIGNPDTFTGAAKLSLVEAAYGYRGLKSPAPSDFGARLMELFSRVPAIARKAGHAVRFLPYHAGGKLLDVGCGNGAFLDLMRRLGWEVEGIEPDSAAAAIAAGRDLRVCVADVVNAELPDSFFDAITLTHVAEHLPFPATAFDVLAGALKRGGTIVSISPNPRGLVRRLFNNKWYQLDPPRHFALPTVHAYRAILEPLGFEVQTWTSMRMSYWAIRESLSMARTGGAHRPGGGLLASILHILLVAISFLVAESGEEVVCYATKK